MTTTELQQLKQQIERLQLGFIDIRYRVVYCNRRCEGANWYTVEDGQQIPIKQNALRGYPDRLEVVELQRRGKDISKLQFTLNCGDLHYVLEAGADSEFAQSLVYALASLTPEQLKQPLIVQPEPGEDNAVLFARVRTNDYRRVFVERSNFQNYEQALELATASVYAASGQKPRGELVEDTPPEPVAAEQQVDAATRFKALTGWTGHTPSQLRALANQLGLPARSSDMTLEQQDLMRNAVFLDWAIKFPVWKEGECLQVYQGIVSQLGAGAADARIWQDWKAHVELRKNGKAR